MGEHFTRWAGPEGPAHRLRPLAPLLVALACVAIAVVLAVTQLGGRAEPKAAAQTQTETPTATATPSPTPTRSTSPTPTPTPSPSKSSAKPKPTATPKPKPTKAAATTGTPLSISVPSIGVSGKLRRTSAVSGVINPPGGVLGWVKGYNRVRPGEVGTAVVAGHVTDGGRPDVFYRLQNVGKGDKITVWDSDGKKVVYTVTATRVATKEAVSRDESVWGSNGSVKRIALITCDDENGYRSDGHRVSNFVAIAEAR